MLLSHKIFWQGTKHYCLSAKAIEVYENNLQLPR